MFGETGIRKTGTHSRGLYMRMMLAIALGGALGAVARHFGAAAILKLTGPGFPYGIFLVNILGCLMMGVLIAVFATKMQVPSEVKAFLTVGFLGAFTTFSTYSMETVMLMDRGAWADAILYAGGSVVLGILGFMVGTMIGKMI